MKGEYFFVERYESDVEDDDSLPTSGRGLSTHRRHGEKEMLIVLTERFIEEQTSRGKVSVGVYVYNGREAFFFFFYSNCISY